MGCDAPGVCDQLGVGCKFACDIRSRASAAYIGYGADLRETLSPSQACRVSFGATTPRRRRASTVPAPCKHSAGHDLGSVCIVLAPDGSDQSRIGCVGRRAPSLITAGNPSVSSARFPSRFAWPGWYPAADIHTGIYGADRLKTESVAADDRLRKTAHAAPAQFSADGGKVTTCSKLRTSRRPAVP